MDVFTGISFYDRLMTQVSFIPISQQLSNVGVWKGFGVPGAATRRGGATRRGLELCHCCVVPGRDKSQHTFQLQSQAKYTHMHISGSYLQSCHRDTRCMTHCGGVDPLLCIF